MSSSGVGEFVSGGGAADRAARGGRWRRLVERPWAVAALAAFGPATWGTTYVTTTELLPPDRPLLAAALRALPAGLLLLAFTRQLPRGAWWWRSAVLGLLNFGAFFPLIFYGAYRLPGGVASTIGALSPLVVAGLGVVVLRARPGRGTVPAALLGLVGVALLVLRADAALDGAGMAAMLLATVLMALAVLLAKRWGRPPGASLLALTGWQLTAGGLVLAPLALLVEGAPPAPTTGHLVGYAYLGLIGTALGYALWFRGIERLPASSMSFLGLANPVVATLAGLVLLGQSLTGWQVVGLGMVLAGVLWGQRAGQRPPSAPAEERRRGGGPDQGGERGGESAAGERPVVVQ
ncbi:EamA family transporter [Streptomyces triticirhizae]|uniref:EamA family transporter n=1 Tax=Streptomyces triticirhizae TaxID=2483353 RepID=A0A3M2LV83_9ACTN|nr:EamA family transporter [Streptomyces triticirhizae]RMI40463.1 EamA family transporter [Streptomyces triticirhizae]